jgi:hypothetical protein
MASKSNSLMAELDESYVPHEHEEFRALARRDRARRLDRLGVAGKRRPPATIHPSRGR